VVSRLARNARNSPATGVISLGRNENAKQKTRAEQPVAPEVKPDPEVKLEHPEIKPEPEVKQEPFTIRGYFGLDK
jgi:hypothetical protein